MAESWGGAWDKAGLDVLVSFPDPTNASVDCFLPDPTNASVDCFLPDPTNPMAQHRSLSVSRDTESNLRWGW